MSYEVGSTSSPPAGPSTECFAGPCYLVSRYRLKLEHCDEYRLFDAFGEEGDAAVRFLYRIFGSQDRELLGALYYDVHQVLLGYAVLHVGTICRALAEPRGFFAAAFLANAASMKLFHFHPSGNLKASEEDRRLTERMKECGRLLGVAVDEHLILGHHGQFARVE